MHQTVYSRCLICDSPWGSFTTPRDCKKYYRCSKCGYIHLLPEFYPSPAEERARYLKHNNSRENTGYVDYLNSIISGWILPRKENVSQILDFGSGPVPVFASLLEEHGFQVSLYDPFFAPREVNLEKTYQMITFIEVIEHVKDPIDVLEKVKSLIPQGSCILIATLLYTDKTNFPAWWYRMDSTHRGFFSEKTFGIISKLLSFTGCSVFENRIILLRK